MKKNRLLFIFLISVFTFTLTNNVFAEEIYDPETRIRALNTIGTSIADDDPDHNLRFIGANPNNYVSFNGQIWRIIGVFDGRLKIIEDPIGDYSWDSSGVDVNDGCGYTEDPDDDPLPSDDKKHAQCIQAHVNEPQQKNYKSSDEDIRCQCIKKFCHFCTPTVNLRNKYYEFRLESYSFEEKVFWSKRKLPSDVYAAAQQARSGRQPGAEDDSRAFVLRRGTFGHPLPPTP